MATILTFSLARRRDTRYRPRNGETATVIPFPGVRYERIDGAKNVSAGMKTAQAAVSPNGKARYKPDF